MHYYRRWICYPSQCMLWTCLYGYEPPPKDAELDGPNQLPQVILTSDLEWNPSSIYFEYDPISWFSQIDDLPDVEQPSYFDDYGSTLVTVLL